MFYTSFRLDHHHHFICSVIQQYAHLRKYDSTRAGQQGPIKTLTAALPVAQSDRHKWGSLLGLVVNKQRMSPGHWLGLILYVTFSDFTLILGCQEGRPACRHRFMW